MRMPAPARSGSRTRIWVLSGGGNAPSSGGSVSRAGASLATVTGRQSGRGRGRAVHHAADEAERLVLAQPGAHDPGLGEHRAHRIEQRLVAGPETLEGEMWALRPASLGEPVAQASAKPLALALQPVARQHGRPRPARQHQGLGRDEGREPPRPLGQKVVEVQAQPFALAARGLGVGLGQLARLVGGALEHDVERMAGSGEGRVEALRRDAHEAVELVRPHHRARAVEADQRDQRAVMADQRPAAPFEGHRRLGREQTLERLAPQRPGQALQVVDGGCEGEGHDASVPTASA